MKHEVVLPELGENLEGADVTAVLVSVGDTVQREQPVIEVETEKASLEVPSTAAGKVVDLRVDRGDTVRVGQVILVVESESEEPAPAPTEEAEPEQAEKAAERAESAESETAESETDEAEAVEPKVTRPVPEEREEREEEEREGRKEREKKKRETEREDAKERKHAGEAKKKVPAAPAAPSVRALARELGVEIGEVPGTGPGGRISRDDVKAFVQRALREGGGPRAAAAVAPPDPARWGEVVREPLKRIRRVTAERMSRAWALVPHVTQFDHADVTGVEESRRAFNRRGEAARTKLTLTAIVLRTAAAALRKFPKFNAVLDPAAGEVVFRKYVHIGVAVDTERGLLVPVVRDVDRKSVLRIAAETSELAARAREGKLGPDEMAGAGFTVSNLGGLGTTWFTPIVNWPEVAILGVGRAEMQAVHEEDHFRPRRILPLSVSYDHRLIDGAEAARFLRWIAEALEQPLLLLLEAEPEDSA